MRLAGKVALITGWGERYGAERGDDLRAGKARRSSSPTSSEFEARQVVEKIAAAGGQARFVKLDVTSEADWRGGGRGDRDGVRASSTSS